MLSQAHHQICRHCGLPVAARRKYCSKKCANAERRRNASERYLRALTMRQQLKMTFREIGEAFGVTVERARQMVLKGLKSTERTREHEGQVIRPADLLITNNRKF